MTTTAVAVRPHTVASTFVPALYLSPIIVDAISEKTWNILEGSGAGFLRAGLATHCYLPSRLDEYLNLIIRFTWAMSEDLVDPQSNLLPFLGIWFFASNGRFATLRSSEARFIKFWPVLGSEHRNAELP